jgi:hypothetical protein
MPGENKDYFQLGKLLALHLLRKPTRYPNLLFESQASGFFFAGHDSDAVLLDSLWSIWYSFCRVAVDRLRTDSICNPSAINIA